MLTADEVFQTSDGILIIQESKNAEDDIKDGLFKLLLYSSIDNLSLEGVRIAFRTRPRLTGEFKGSIELPADADRLRKFCEQNALNKVHHDRLR
ncbi:MAG: hypothetical protein C4335_00260 [Armatimonadota bacterium]